jgi:hypothetical protein
MFHPSGEVGKQVMMGIFVRDIFLDQVRCRADRAEEGMSRWESCERCTPGRAPLAALCRTDRAQGSSQRRGGDDVLAAQCGELAEP